MEYKGKISGRGMRVAIVISRFNAKVTEMLKGGAIDCLLRHEVKNEDIDVYWTPGSFELPMVLKNVVNNREYDGYIVLGALIRGDTPHFDYIAGETTKGIAKISLESAEPVAFGVITADTEEQALSRAGLKQGNKGWDSAIAILEMIDLYKKIKGGE
ncbi:6,7-dimethyl-8-ribityllumazine synthase [candidate division WOR-3 bacterium]|nr:6,7-dimethyl-8-ribityllumazine synthase [candidate division WOR-3 bacterium]MCK4527143.1 6,7-dimethyl-8-ribityllumazine synthase [candidate division WOR-3 bacterium]